LLSIAGTSRNASQRQLAHAAHWQPAAELAFRWEHFRWDL
jgi:hypothetical protein